MQAGRRGNGAGGLARHALCAECDHVVSGEIEARASNDVIPVRIDDHELAHVVDRVFPPSLWM